MCGFREDVGVSRGSKDQTAQCGYFEASKSLGGP
jgi:hypothetical protein